MTALLAAELAPNATNLRDIGAGIGSVGLMTLEHASQCNLGDGGSSANITPAGPQNHQAQ